MYMTTVNVKVLLKIKLFASMITIGLVDVTRKRFSEWGVVVEWILVDVTRSGGGGGDPAASSGKLCFTVAHWQVPVQRSARCLASSSSRYFQRLTL